MKLKVSIIILNWNGWKDTIECLESLYQITYPNYDVILVDNGSEDESIKKIKEYCQGKIKINSKFYKYDPYSKPITIIEIKTGKTKITKKQYEQSKKSPSNRKIFLIKNDDNLGFAEGNNIGMRLAISTFDTDYILLLNNDTIVKKSFLNFLVLAAEKEKRVGICSSKIINMHNSRIIDSTGHIFKWGHIVDRGNGRIDRGQYDKKKSIIGAMAAACLYKKEMIEDVGLFDPIFITQYEDVDLSWRSFMKGWKGKFVPEAVVYHKRGASIKKNSIILYKMQILGLKNSVLVVKRNANSYQKYLFSIFFIFNGFLNIFKKLTCRSSVGIIYYFKWLFRIYE